MARKNTPVVGTLVAAGQALTASYVAQGGVIRASGFDQLSILLDYTKGDETQINFKVQFSDTLAFTNAYERVVTDTDATGVANCLSSTFKRTTTGKIEIPIAIRGHYLKVLFQAPDGTPTGTFGAGYRLDNIDR